MAKNKVNGEELQTIKVNEADIQTHQAIELGIASVENLDLAAIFFSVGTSFFEDIGKVIFLPAAGVLSLARAAWSWYLVYLTRGKSRYLTGSLIETAAVIGVGAAVVASFVAAAIIGPIIFASVLGGRALYNLAATGYYIGKSIFFSPTKEKRNEYLSRAARHAGVTLANTVACIGCTLALVVGKIALAPIAGVGGLIGAAIAGFGIFKIIQSKLAAKKQAVNADTKNQDQPTQTASPKPKRGINDLLELDFDSKSETSALLPSGTQDTIAILQQLETQASTHVTPGQSIERPPSMIEIKPEIQDNDSQYEAEERAKEQNTIKVASVPNSINGDSSLFRIIDEYTRPPSP